MKWIFWGVVVWLIIIFVVGFNKQMKERHEKREKLLDEMQKNKKSKV